jgi:hypothetical protein
MLNFTFILNAVKNLVKTMTAVVTSPDSSYSQARTQNDDLLSTFTNKKTEVNITRHSEPSGRTCLRQAGSLLKRNSNKVE